MSLVAVATATPEKLYDNEGPERLRRESTERSPVVAAKRREGYGKAR